MSSIDFLQQHHADVVISQHVEFDRNIVQIDRTRMLPVMKALQAERRFNLLIDLTCVDYLGQQKPRFTLIYELYSLPTKERLRIHLKTDDDVEIDTVSGIWRNANWLERELFDMFGIRFRNHPDLRRILCHHEFKGHALRKDYPVDKGQWCSDLEELTFTS